MWASNIGSSRYRSDRARAARRIAIVASRRWLGGRDAYISDPVGFATLKAIRSTFAVKVRRCSNESGLVDAIECVHVDDCVQMVVDCAGHERYRTATRTDKEVGGSCPKPVLRDEGRVTNLRDKL